MDPKYLIIASLTTMHLGTTQAHADFWSDAVGILTDPLKIDEGTENILHAVERSFILAERLESKTNKDIEDRLAQIDTTISETRTWITEERLAVESTVTDTLKQIRELEDEFFSDAGELVKCSGVVTANTIRAMLADSLNDLGKRKPRFVAFGWWTLGQVEIDQSDIPSPISGFREALSLYEKALSEVREDDPPSAITDIYAEVQRLADQTRCHYKNRTKVYQDLLQIELEFNRRDRSWLG